MDVRSVPPSFGTKYIFVGWKIAKKNYQKFLGLALIFLFIGLISAIPFVGPIISAILAVVAHVGYALMMRDFVDGKSPDLSKVFIIFEDRDLFNFVLPFLFLDIVLALPGILSRIAGGSGGVAMLIWNILILPISLFCLQLMVFKRVQLFDAIKASYNGALSNVVMIVWMMCFILIMAIVAIVCFVFPIFFVFFPAVLPVWYLTYATVFEGLDLLAVEKRFTEIEATV